MEKNNNSTNDLANDNGNAVTEAKMRWIYFGYGFGTCGIIIGILTELISRLI